MKNAILATILFTLLGCGSSVLPIAPIINPPVVVQQPPMPIPVPNTGFYIGEVVFVRNWYGRICRGRIVNFFNNGFYLLNPVVCNNYLYYYNVTLPFTDLYR